LDHDGKVLFSHDAQGAHQDAAYALRAPDGLWRLLFGNGGIHCLTVDGRELWHHPLGEAQHVVAGRFQDSSPVQLVVIDRTPQPHHRDQNAWGILFLYDIDGKEIWRRQQEKGAWAIAPVPIRWFGPDASQGILVYGQGYGSAAAIYDGNGNIVDTLPMAYTDDRTEADRKLDFYALAADVWGDAREEAVLFSSRGACIYGNARLLETPTLYNETLYPGM
jgi:hypothetical protein